MKLEKQLLKEFINQTNRVKTDLHMLSKVVLFTLVNGKADSEMVLANKHGLMAQNTSANGETIEHMDKANLSMSMVISMTDSGLMIKRMVQALTSM